MADITTSSLDGILKGNTSSRPASSNNGDLYINTETGFIEIYSSTYGWESVGATPSIVTFVSATNAPSGRAYNNGSASVSFTAGSITGKSYTVTSSPGSYTTTGSSSPLTVTGLQSSTQYTYTVTATNNYGTSAASSASSGVTATTVPQAPTISAAAATDTAATITITPGATGGSSITQYSIVSNPVTTTQTTSSSPYTFTGLTTGTEYTFTATATNANGTSAASLASNSITPTAVGDFESISSVLLTSNSAQINFTSIPNTYQHLQIRGIGRVVATGTGQSDGLIQVGSSNTIDTSSIYSRFDMYGSNSTAGASADINKSNQFAWSLPRDGEGTGEYYPFIIDIYDYANTNKKKTISYFTGGSFADTNSIVYLGSILYNSTNTINCIRFSSNSQFVDKTEVALFGVKG